VNNPQCYVVDTNTIIDLHCGKLLQKIFHLPCTFIITDFIIHELREPPFQELSSMGLHVESLNPDEILQITEMMERYEKPSYEDISVLILAKSKKTVLITGDEALRHAAIANEVECRGTCWLIDYLANRSLISFSEAIEAYERIQKKPRFPPKDECRGLRSQWVKKKKMLE